MGLDCARIMDMIAHVLLHETERAEEEGGEPDYSALRLSAPTTACTRLCVSRIGVPPMLSRRRGMTSPIDGPYPTAPFVIKGVRT
jgi:hypothetical protein